MAFSVIGWDSQCCGSAAALCFQEFSASPQHEVVLHFWEPPYIPRVGKAVGLTAVIIFFQTKGLETRFLTSSVACLWRYVDIWMFLDFETPQCRKIFRGFIQNVKPNLVYHKPPTSQHPFPVSSCLRKVMKGFLETSPQ